MGLAFLLASPLHAAEPPIAPVTTHHHVVVGGQSVDYDATFAEQVLTDQSGKPQATISGTAYVRSGVSNQSARPVTFAFNGGPGASSSPLHFSAFGPRLVERRGKGESPAIRDNPQSLIDITDLVFVDPVGTGFSRVLEGGDGQRYWSVDGDAEAVLGFIRDWLKRNGRTGSPVYIAGESYGGTRLAEMLGDAKDINLAGLIFISPALANVSDESDLGYVFALPSMAVAAVQNGKVDARGRSVEAIFGEARAFAMGDYLLALVQGSRLPVSERDKIAARMSALIGLPAQFIAGHHLRIDAETFRKTLREKDGLVVGRLDTRVTAPIPKNVPDRPSAANDPALGLGASNVIVSDTIGTYMRHELHVPTTEPYISLTLDVNFKWTWPPTRGLEAPSYTANIAKIMADKPKLRLLLIGGYYDLAVPLLAPRYALDHAWLPEDRVRMVALETGHSAFEGDEGRTAMKRLLQSFIAN
ncbi:MAG TPA: peptidase S10 [Sphingomicrobium sp.]|nr:peptidase S10 [Sphingomicrobium sp.]